MSRGAEAGKVVDAGPAKIVGHLNVAGRIAATASLLYAKNVASFLETMIDKDAKALKIDFADDLVKATLLTRDGAVVHPNFARPAAPAPAAPTMVAAAENGVADDPAAAAQTGEA